VTGVAGPASPRQDGDAGLRRAVAAAIGIAIVVAATVPYALWWPRLPDPMAVHWSIGGGSNGAMSKTAAAVIGILPASVCGLITAVLCLRGPGRSASGAWPGAKAAAIIAGIGTLLAATSWSVVLANKDAASWHDAAHIGFAAILVGLLLGAAVLAAVAWLTRVRKMVTADVQAGFLASPPAPGGLLRPGERAAWTGRAHLAWWLPLVLIAIGAVIVISARSAAGALPSALLLLVYLAFGWIKVSVDVRGLRIRYGLLPWPVTSVPLDHIRRAERIDLRPLEWGGWGYRGSRKVFARAAVVLRGGDAIKLQLTDGSEFAVTVDDAATGAALLADLLAPEGVSGSPPA
jgi:uncharacterized membrane protein